MLTSGSMWVATADASCMLSRLSAPSWRARSANACGSSSSANAGLLRAIWGHVESVGPDTYARQRA